MNLEIIQLSDFLTSYPSPYDHGFQEAITAKKEFSDYPSIPNELLDPKNKKRFFNHQIFVQRILRRCDRLVIVDNTGTGKTCTVLGAVLMFLNERNKMNNNQPFDEQLSYIKQAVILSRGSNQRNEIRNQLVCVCSEKGVYETPESKNATSETNQKILINREIKSSGIILDESTTYATFAHRIREQMESGGINNLIEKYSDTFFWCDEVHNLLKDPNAKESNEREKDENYRIIHQFFHLVKRCKIVLSTATPMINDILEVEPLFNLVLPLNGQIPDDYDYQNAPKNDYRVLFPGLNSDPSRMTRQEISKYYRGQIPIGYIRSASLEDIEPYFRGKITFVRSTDVGAKPKFQGEKIEYEYERNNKVYHSNLILYTSLMSDFQATVYQKSNQQIQNEFNISQRQASNFVFPDQTYGGGITDEEREYRLRNRKLKGIESSFQFSRDESYINQPIPIDDQDLIFENVEFERKGFRKYVKSYEDNYYAIPQFQIQLQNLENIRMMSCKYAAAIELIMNDPGNAFVYQEIVEGSGIIIFGLCLEAMGYERYNYNTSIFEGSSNRVKPFCASSRGLNNRIRPGIRSRKEGAPPRYAILSGNTPNTVATSIMETMNSYENRHGDYIQVLISSRVGRDGINVNNVTQIHILAPEWTPSAIYQAISRGIRATSHNDLLNEARDLAIIEGRNPNNVKLEIKVYKHCAISPDYGAESIDFEMYQIAEQKDIEIKQVFRMMKQCAIGCQINRARNILPSDKPGSPECDYQECDYPCSDPSPSKIDYSTYDVHYSNEEINNIILILIKIFRTTNIISFFELTEILNKRRPKIILMALERLIVNKIPINDQFGYQTYIYEDRGIFYLDRNYPNAENKSSVSTSYYNNGIIIINQVQLKDVNRIIGKNNFKIVQNELYELDPTSPEFNIFLNRLDLEYQVQILEDMLIEYANGDRSDFTLAIFQNYNKMIFIIPDPIDQINQKIEELQVVKIRRGRKSLDKSPKFRRVKKSDIPEINPDQDKVYLHILYSQEVGQNSYSLISRFIRGDGRIRLYRPSEKTNEFRDLNSIELSIFNKIIQVEINRKFQGYSEKGIYGFEMGDNEFRIAEGNIISSDARKNKRGKVCKTWDKYELLNVMFEIGVSLPEDNKVPENIDQLELTKLLSKTKIGKSKYLINKMSFDDQYWYYSWIKSLKFRREIICKIIKDRMIESGRFVS